MSKERKSQSRLPMIMAGFAIAALIALLVWYFQGRLTPRIEVKPPTLRQTSLYDSYTVTSLRAADNIYYIQLKDVVCDASSPARSNQKHYFRISITFETDTKEKAAAISKKYPEAVKDLRDIVASLRPADISNEKTMAYIKSNMKRRLENLLGANTVSGVYFEEVLAQ